MAANRGRVEILLDKKVIYYIEVNGRLVVIDNVPARVNIETGENHFSPETVERLRSIVDGQRSPVRFIHTPVYEFV